MSMSSHPARTLLAIIEQGGYPDFAPLYEQAGFEVITERSVRRAISLLKGIKPSVIVAEFNFQSDFRDRTSSLESLLATVQRIPGVRVVVFHEKEYAHQLEKLTARFPLHATIAYPIDEDRLAAAVSGRIA
jgi:hypothetical protein